MDAAKFHFVINSSSPEDSRSAELARATARSHAARFSHNRLRQPLIHEGGQDGTIKSNLGQVEGKKTVHEPFHKGKTQKFRVYIANKKPQTKTVRQVQSTPEDVPIKEDPVSPPPLPRSISKSALDPFITTATDLSVPDMHLLHLYFSACPHDIFGTTSSPVSAIVHEKTVENAVTIDIELHWCLLALETNGASLQPTESDRQLSILKRRNHAYKSMHKRISEQKTAHHDDFILSLSVATSIEQRLGNLEAAAYHAGAIKKLLDQRGGLKALRDIDYPSNLMVLNSLIGIGLPELYKGQEILPKLVELRLKLRTLQTWNYNIRHTKKTQDGGGASSKDTTAGKRPSRGDHLSSRVRAFNEHALFEYISVPPRPLSAYQYRFLLPILFTINCTLWAFRDDEKITQAYIDLLSDSAKRSASTNFIMQCAGTKLPSLLLVVMLGQYAAGSPEARNESTNTVFAVEEILEFVELVMMSSPDSRHLVLKAMWSWLTMTGQDDLDHLSASKVDILAAEIESKWLEDKIRGSKKIYLE